MNVRWWRMAVLFERDGAPLTWTMHVRAFTEASARALVAREVEGKHLVYACAPSEPLARVAPKEEVVARYGPYARSWEDPALDGLRVRFGRM